MVVSRRACLRGPFCAGWVPCWDHAARCHVAHSLWSRPAPFSHHQETFNPMSTASVPSQPADVELPRRIVIASMAGVMAAMLMAALDGTIVETAMPRAIAEMNGFEHYTAGVTMYLLASTAVVPIVGKLSDLYGRKPFLLAGVAIFVAGSALCGLAHSMIQLVFFRGLQGIGAGFTQAMAFT